MRRPLPQELIRSIVYRWSLEARLGHENFTPFGDRIHTSGHGSLMDQATETAGECHDDSDTRVVYNTDQAVPTLRDRVCAFRKELAGIQDGVTLQALSALHPTDLTTLGDWATFLYQPILRNDTLALLRTLTYVRGESFHQTLINDLPGLIPLNHARFINMFNESPETHPGPTTYLAAGPEVYATLFQDIKTIIPMALIHSVAFIYGGKGWIEPLDQFLAALENEYRARFAKELIDQPGLIAYAFGQIRATAYLVGTQMGQDEVAEQYRDAALANPGSTLACARLNGWTRVLDDLQARGVQEATITPGTLVCNYGLGMPFTMDAHNNPSFIRYDPARPVVQ
ncbi:hypothetical protein IWQ60_004318 [Tieghemiomyces parasiticus]|uniref:Uncharacterized protein n=1 Tax=Tieghemiomyces parasiticus TaxID=78921 RepID=A0A9W8AGF8_9FUNG|nr:hypothetical protein IWQ60_004318 [Tieghemiomyces parasiticus]